MEIIRNESRTLTITPEELKDEFYMKTLRNKYGYRKDPFYGVNEDDEPVEIHVSYSQVLIITYQNNHWIRYNVYKEDGTNEEYFEGKW